MLFGKPVTTAFILLFIIGSAVNSCVSFTAFSQEIDMSNDAASQGTDANPSQINGSSFLITGRINSMLMPAVVDTNNDAMDNSMIMPQMMDNGSAVPTTANDSAVSQAMRYSMARDVVWLLSGDWVLVSSSNDSSNSTILDVEFVKVTTNGTMLHTHRITNFVPVTSASDITAAFNSNINAATATIMGKADVYFNDELAWSQADTTLSIMNGTVLMINIDSEDIDDHFHDQPIYGTVNMLSRDDGFTITLPTPRSIQEKIEQELAELGVNATQAQSAIESRATQVGTTFADEATDVLNNITNSIRDIMVTE
jgi:hypothetical protein